MAYRVELHPLAEVELWEAVDWYDAQAADLGKAFARAVQEMVQAIQANPRQFPLIYKKKYRALIRRFPFVIVFELMEEAIFILAIFHTSRDPKIWKAR